MWHNLVYDLGIQIFIFYKFLRMRNLMYGKEQKCRKGYETDREREELKKKPIYTH